MIDESSPQQVKLLKKHSELSQELQPEEFWKAKYDRLRQDSDRKIQSLIDEADRNLNALGHQYAVIDRLRWALALCKGKLSEDNWDEDIQKFAESR